MSIRKLQKSVGYCFKCGHAYYRSCVRACPHPAVNRVYGSTICIYCCRKCKFHTKTPFCGAGGCSYENDMKESDIIERTEKPSEKRQTAETERGRRR